MKYIETERLILREWTLNDVHDQVEGLSNFETAKNLAVPFPYTEKDSIEYISKHSKNGPNKYAFAIELKGTKKVIGGTDLGLNSKHENYCSGIWLNENYTGKGYGTETYIALDKFAFEVLNIDKIEEGFFEFNNRSKHLHEKVGYKIIGKSTAFCPALNHEVVEILTRLTKANFYNALKAPKLKEVYNNTIIHN